MTEERCAQCGGKFIQEGERLIGRHADDCKYNMGDIISSGKRQQVQDYVDDLRAQLKWLEEELELVRAQNVLMARGLNSQAK